MSPFLWTAQPNATKLEIAGRAMYAAECASPHEHMQASRPGYETARDPLQPESGQQEVRGMAIRTQSRITIASRVTDVWAYVCDVTRWPEWAPTVLEGWVRGGGPLQRGSRVEQRAKGILGTTRRRSQGVTTIEAPRRVAFAGPMGTSAARWGMELEPIGERQTGAQMWIEVYLAGIMRAIPGSILKVRIQRVSDREMAAIKVAVESATPDGSERYVEGGARGYRDPTESRSTK